MENEEETSLQEQEKRKNTNAVKDEDNVTTLAEIMDTFTESDSHDGSSNSNKVKTDDIQTPEEILQ